MPEPTTDDAEHVEPASDNHAGSPTVPPSGGGASPPPGGNNDDPTSLVLKLLSQTVERQIEASHETARRVDRLGERMESGLHNMGTAIGSEIREGMHRQNRMMLILLGLAIVIIGSAAGVTFMGERDADGSITIHSTPGTETP